MIIDGAARAASQDRSSTSRLARALMTAVAAEAVSDPAIATAIVAARVEDARGTPALLRSDHGNVVVRSPHPSIQLLELPCDAEAGHLFRAGAPLLGAAAAAAADEVESGNHSVSALRGALGLCATTWPRELLHIHAAQLGHAAATALPFLHSVRCDGLGQSESGPTLSLRLLSEPDDRQLAWNGRALGFPPERGAEDLTTLSAPLAELFTDPVFRARADVATRTVLATSADTAGARFVCQDVEFSVTARFGGLVLGCMVISDVPPGVPSWMELRQVVDPRVALSARLAIAAEGWTRANHAVGPAIVKAAEDAGFGALQRFDVGWQRDVAYIAMHFALPDG